MTHSNEDGHYIVNKSHTLADLVLRTILHLSGDCTNLKGLQAVLGSCVNRDALLLKECNGSETKCSKEKRTVVVSQELIIDRSA